MLQCSPVLGRRLAAAHAPKVLGPHYQKKLPPGQSFADRQLSWSKIQAKSFKSNIFFL